MTRIDADETSLRYVVQTANAPATVARFEHLKLRLQWMLNDTVQAAAVTFAPSIALVNAGDYGFLQSLVYIADVIDRSAWITKLSTGDCELPALASSFVETVVFTIATAQEIRIQIQLYAFRRDPLCGVFARGWFCIVEIVHTRYRHEFASV